MAWQIRWYYCECGAPLGRKPGLCLACKIRKFGYECTKCKHRSLKEKFVDGKCPYCGSQTEFELDKAVHFHSCRFCNGQYRSDQGVCPHCGKLDREMIFGGFVIVAMILMTGFGISIIFDTAGIVKNAMGIGTLASFAALIACGVYLDRKKMVARESIVSISGGGLVLVSFFILLAFMINRIANAEKFEYVSHIRGLRVIVYPVQPGDESTMKLKVSTMRGTLHELYATGISKAGDRLPLVQWVKKGAQGYPEISFPLKMSLRDLRIETFRKAIGTNPYDCITVVFEDPGTRKIFDVTFEESDERRSKLAASDFSNPELTDKLRNLYNSTK